MKRRILFISGLLALVVLACGLVACSGKVAPAASPENEYMITYRSDWQGDNDADMTIDGKLDEARWQDKKWYTTCAPYSAVNESVWLKTTAFTTEYGVYIAAVLYDDNIVGDGEFDVTQGTCLEYHYSFRKEDGKLYNASYTDRGRFFLDVFGNYCTKGERMKRGVTVDGVVNSGETVSATFEVFVPWEQTSVKVTEEWHPDKVYVLPGCRVISEGQTYSLCTLGMVTERWRRDYQAMYYEFDENGYTKVDASGAVLGDAKNGFAKSAGWNLDKLAENEVSLDKTYEYDYIFFRDAFATNFEASMTIYPGEYLYDLTDNGIVYDTNGLEKYYDGRSGFYLLTTTGQEFVPYLEYNDQEHSDNALVEAADGTKVPERYHVRSLDNFVAPWHVSEVCDKENAKKEGAVQFSMIKYGADLFYFADGVYLGTQRVSSLNDNVYVGLYNCNRAATYKNYSFTAYTDDEVKARLDESELYPVNISAGAGGRIECAQTWAKKGETVTFKAVCESGNEVQTIKLGEQDVTAACKASVQPYGKYTVTVADTADISVAFGELAELSTISGMVYSGSEKTPSAATLKFASVSDHTAVYSARATSANGYTVSLPNGTYAVFVTFGTKNAATRQITVTGDGTHDIYSTPLDVEVGNIELTDEGYFNTAYEDKNNRAYFDTIDAGESFVLETKMKDMGAKDYPSAGVILSKGGKHWVRFVIRHLPDDGYDFVIWRDLWDTPDYFGKVIDSFGDPFAGGEATLKLVHNNGRYFIYVNGSLIAEASENDVYDNGNTIAGALGDGQKLSLGLFAERDVTFIDWNWTVGRNSDSIQGLLGKELTVADGVDVAINGEAASVTEGKIGVLLGDEVTVSKAPANLMFSLSGKPISTEVIDGKSVAKFIVTQESDAITYESAYAVTGHVVGGDADTVVTIANASGVVYTGNTNASGDYSAMLAEGEYTVYAQSATQITGVETVTVSGAAATVKDIAFARPIIDTWATVNQYTIDHATGDYKSLAEQNQNGGWFAGIEVQSSSYYVLTATVKGMTTDKIKDKWPSVGFMVGTQEKWLRFTVQRFDLSDEYRVALFRSYDKPITYGNLGTPFATGSMDLKLVYANGTYYFYVNGAQVYTSTESVGNGKTRVGLFNDWQITFTNWGYKAGRNEMPDELRKQLTVQNGVTVKVNGEDASVEGGKIDVLLGDKVTASVAAHEGETLNILVNGSGIETTQESGKAVAEFTVGSDTESIDYSIAYAVSGHVEGGDANTKVTIVSESGTVAYEGKADENGNYSATLAAGVYKVSAQSATHITNVATVTVTDEAKTVEPIALSKPLVTEWFTDFNRYTFDYKTGAYKTVEEKQYHGGWFAENIATAPYVLTATIKDMTDTANYSSVGFMVGDTESWLRFTVQYDKAGNYRFVLWRSGVGTTVGQNITDPFGNDGSMTLRLERVGKDYIFYVNGKFVYTTNTDVEPLGSGNRVGLFNEYRVTFTEWNCEALSNPTVYAVSGSVTNGDENTTVTVMNTNGLVHSGKAIDGAFTVSLPNGTYYVSAQSATHISNVATVTVADETKTVDPIALSKPLVTEYPFKDGETPYTQYAFDYTTGDYKAEGTHFHGGWFAETEAEDAPYVLTATVKDMTTEMTTGKFPSVGFMVGTTESWLRFTVQRKDTSATYQVVLWRSGGDPIVGQNIANPFGSDGTGSMTLRLERVGKAYIFYVNGELVYTTNTDVEPLGSGNRVGLFNEYRVTFTDWDYEALPVYTVSGRVTDGDANTIVTVANAKGVVYSGNAGTDGAFTASLPSGEYYVSAQSETQITNVATVTVNGANAALESELTFVRAAFTSTVGSGTFDYTTGYYTTAHDEKNNRAYFDTINAGASFVLETTMKDMATVESPSAGVILKKEGEINWVRFVVANMGGKFKIVIWRDLWDTNDYFGKVFDLPGDPFTGPNNTLNFKLVYHNGLYTIYLNEAFTAQVTENDPFDHGNTIAGALGEGQTLSMGVFAERDVTFIDWGYEVLFTSTVGSGTFDYETGNYQTVQDITDNQAYFAQAAGKTAFTLEATMKGMGDGNDWPSAGFILSAGGESWFKFVVRNAGGSKYDIVAWRNISGDKYCAKTAEFPTEMQSNPFTGTDGTLRLKLTYAAGTYTLFVNDVQVFQIGESEAIENDGHSHTIASILGKGNVNFGLFGERQITFTDWKFTANA